MPRLRRTFPDQPGWTRRRAGTGFIYLDERGNRLAATSRAAGQGPRDPAGVAGRLDLPVAQRPPAGGRYGRRRPPAVPLPPRLAHPARRREVREDAELRQGAVEGPRAGAGRPRRRGHDARSARARSPYGCSTSATSGSATTSTPRRTAASGSPRCSGGTSAREGDALRLRLRGQVRDRALHHHRRPGDRRGARGDAPPARGRTTVAGVEGRAELARRWTRRRRQRLHSHLLPASTPPPRTSAPGTPR